MARSRSSAKAAGTRFEGTVVGYLAGLLGDWIERRARNGSKDRGDVAGLTDSYGRRIVVECKDYNGQLKPAEWLAEAELERQHDNAYVGVVVAKRRGIADAGRQYVLLELGDLAKLLTPPTPQDWRPPAMTADAAPLICPECRDGKCRNCDGSAWSEATDSLADCPCSHPNTPQE